MSIAMAAFEHQVGALLALVACLALANVAAPGSRAGELAPVATAAGQRSSRAPVFGTAELLSASMPALARVAEGPK